MEIRTRMGLVQIKYDNGILLSIANGFGSYTQNNFDVDKQTKIIENRDIFASWTSEDVEIAIIAPGGEYITKEILKEAEDLVTTVTVKQLINIMHYLLNMEE